MKANEKKFQVSALSSALIGIEQFVSDRIAELKDEDNKAAEFVIEARGLRVSVAKGTDKDLKKRAEGLEVIAAEVSNDVDAFLIKLKGHERSLKGLGGKKTRTRKAGSWS